MFDIISNRHAPGLVDVSNLLLAFSANDMDAARSAAGALNSDLAAIAALKDMREEHIFLDTFQSLYRLFRGSSIQVIRDNPIATSDLFSNTCGWIFGDLFPYDLGLLVKVYDLLYDSKYLRKDLSLEDCTSLVAASDRLSEDYRILRYILARTVLNRQLSEEQFDAKLVQELTEAIRAQKEVEDDGLTLISTM